VVNFHPFSKFIPCNSFHPIWPIVLMWSNFHPFSKFIHVIHFTHLANCTNVVNFHLFSRFIPYNSFHLCWPNVFMWSNFHPFSKFIPCNFISPHLANCINVIQFSSIIKSLTYIRVFLKSNPVFTLSLGLFSTPLSPLSFFLWVWEVRKSKGVLLNLGYI